MSTVSRGCRDDHRVSHPRGPLGAVDTRAWSNQGEGVMNHMPARNETDPIATRNQPGEAVYGVYGDAGSAVACLESEVRSYCRDFPAVFDRASGSLLFDTAGRRIIDFLSGAGALNYGHNHPQLKAVLQAYLAEDRISHALDLTTRAKVDFLCAFDEVILRPRRMNYKIQMTGPTGTNAVEAALKLARKVTGRTEIASFTNAFHGVTLGALAATGARHKRGGAGQPLTNVVRLPYDGYLGPGIDTLDYVEKLLGDPGSGVQAPAAFIVEAVQGEGGLQVAQAAWLERLQAIAREHGTLLILDEIQVGIGRTGPFFCFEHADIRPDIIILSKSLSGFGLPMSMVLIDPNLDHWTPGEHNGTFRGNNLAFITATRALDWWRDDGFEREIGRKAAILSAGLEAITAALPAGSAHRKGVGLLQGLSFSVPAAARKMSELAFEAGLMIETCGPHGEVVKFMPSLVIEDTLLQEGLDLAGAAAQQAVSACPVQ
ncbi:MAG: diaminobutyrate--2-oxoglutarate transaminase [Salinarimonas sp.]